MYDVGRKPTQSQVFAQRICHIALTVWGFPIEALSDNGLEHLADESTPAVPRRM